MVTAFLITTLIIFSMNLVIALLTVWVYSSDKELAFPVIPTINVLVCLAMITWNIFALVSI